MIIEYPEYYERFRCIGGDCPDTCCAGWEVDIDEESGAYYKSVSGDFGDRLRANICEDEGERYFPLTPKNRCPFLNDKNLCDIYINLGEESLCQTCTEYPRYFMDIGSYEQMDMSLSCMELGRIFYTETDRINYIRSENDVCGEELDPEEQATLIEVLALRNQCIETMQDAEGSYWDKFSAVRALVAAAQGMTQEEGDETRTYLKEDYRDLIALLESMDSINDEWTQKLSYYKTVAHDENRLAMLDSFIQKNENSLNIWMSKTAVYFIFRYFIDTCIDGDIDNELCLVHRSLKLIFFMLFAEWINKGTVDVSDIIYVSHLYSKEVEHDESNVSKLKNL